MKKKKKQKYIEYDYEEAYKKSLHDLEEANAERMLREGYIRSIYATKEIKAGDVLDIEIYPEFTKKERGKIPDEGRKKKKRIAQHNLNERNSRKECERTINANFDDSDIWATFTYSKEYTPASLEVAEQNMKNYIRRLNYWRKKAGLQKARYVYVTECGDKGRWHHHIVLDGDMEMDTVEELWKLGRRNQVRRLKKDESGLTGMSMYITKPKGKDGRKNLKTWKASKGLKKPEVKKNHYKFKQKDVNDVVTGRKELKDKLGKWYAKDGYKMISQEIRYNTMNGRYYISARLYRTQRDTGRRKENNARNKKAVSETLRGFRARAGDGLGKVERT